MNKSRLLMTEQPIVINKELAKVVGLNEAIVLQQIEYWININRTAEKENAFHDGYYWTYNTIQEWQEQFPFWSYDTVKRTLNKLRKKEILITGRYNKEGFDRTIWYRINYSLLDNLADNKNSISAKCTNQEKSHLQEIKSSKPLKINNSAKCPNAIVQNAPMQQGNLHHTIPEINTEINTEITSSSKNNHKLVRLFEENICKLRKTTLTKFIDLIDKYEKDFLISVMKECTLTNVHSYKGFETAVTNYINANCKTAEDVHRYAIQFTASKKQKNNSYIKKSNKENRFTDYEGQRDYDYNSLERKLLGWDKPNDDTLTNNIANDILSAMR